MKLETLTGEELLELYKILKDYVDYLKLEMQKLEEGSNK